MIRFALIVTLFFAACCGTASAQGYCYGGNCGHQYNSGYSYSYVYGGNPYATWANPYRPMNQYAVPYYPPASAPLTVWPTPSYNYPSTYYYPSSSYYGTYGRRW